MPSLKLLVDGEQCLWLSMTLFHVHDLSLPTRDHLRWHCVIAMIEFNAQHLSGMVLVAIIIFCDGAHQVYFDFG